MSCTLPAGRTSNGSLPTTNVLSTMLAAAQKDVIPGIVFTWKP